MSTSRQQPHGSCRFGLSPMLPRDPREAHRSASSLELFFDLVFVVAVSFASQRLHNLESTGHIGNSLMMYAMVFFAIWWAWMNFSWFATSFVTDDWLYRVMTIVQMVGALVLAAGVPEGMDEGNLTIVTLGYVLMRLAMVGQWLRASASSQEFRGTAIRYVIGVVAVQIAWLLRLALPANLAIVSFAVLAAAEIAVPLLAESRRTTPWNPGHITDRYGAFTLIVLGESILAAANVLVDALGRGEHIARLLALAACGILMAAGMWWVYFARDQNRQILGNRSTMFFAYGHYLIFAAAGAFSSGIELFVDALEGSEMAARLAPAALGLPVLIFLAGVWVLMLRHCLGRAGDIWYALGVGVVALSCFLSPQMSPIGTTIGVILAVIGTEIRRNGEEKS
ncbi:MAG: low temperature requirement protein A [Bifidobacterium crudilactis]|uniref:Low temperature requirement protein A n=1 Tax=Bifidobacterium crudilactis TaxID=327277 RepID=A0A971IDI9_9BIFI|nr:low temperature requirement protein A [Bifidobacterium crudilactis]NLT80404.1 low temperature requirement protein A [Bifidobacterium crudilactis]